MPVVLLYLSDCFRDRTVNVMGVEQEKNMAVSGEKDIQQTKSRFYDLARKSYQQNMFTFTGFLGLSEQDLFWQEEKELSYAGYEFFGGADHCDRLVLRFGNPQELGYEEPFGIVCVHIAPLSEKFADDLSHRDFLGALMNLGIERVTLGDIRVGHKEAYLFCLESIAPFICEHLEQVRHTRVRCRIVEQAAQIPEEEPQTVTVQVSSERIDAVIAKVYNRSRNDVTELFRSAKVYLQGRVCENNSRMLKEQDVVNVRGFGKFIYLGNKGETRKGKLNVQAAVFR